MFAIDDFVLKYENYTDGELIEIYHNMADYSEEANEALMIVIQKNGGFDELVKRLSEKQVLANEISRIEKETAEFGLKGVDASFIKKTASSTILSQDEVEGIIDRKYSLVQLELEDKKIKPRTVVGSLIGGTIASLVGGVLWGLQLIYSKRMFYILLVGLVLLCYGIIKLITGQSKKNNAVLVATILSVLLSLIIGQLLYEIIGYRQ
jgi:hypothetical protein